MTIESRATLKRAIVLCLTLALAVTLGVAGNAATELVSRLPYWHGATTSNSQASVVWSIVWLGGMLAVAALLSIGIYKLRGSVFTSRAVVLGQGLEKPHAALVLFVSFVNVRHALHIEAAEKLARSSVKDLSAAERLAILRDLAERPSTEPPFWSFQQPLRLLAKELSGDGGRRRPSLREIVLCPTPEALENKHVETFQKLFSPLLETWPSTPGSDTPTIAITVMRAIGADDYNAYHDMLASKLAELSARYGGHAAVCVDITSGQRIAPLAAAVATMNLPGMAFSYVTGTGEVLFYDASIKGFGGE